MKRLGSKDIEAMITSATKNPLPAVSPEDVLGTSVINLKVADVMPYERNPRVASNEKLMEIKESIRVRGLDQMFTIVKRPGESHYITSKGGCTRLQALQLLAKEDSPDAERFKYADFLVGKYKSEVDLHVGHLTENLQRSDMTFWDTANGFMGMKAELEKSRQLTLTTRDFGVWLKEQGFSASEIMVQDYQFAVKHFASLPDTAKSLIGRNDIRNVLRPAFTLLQALWAKHPGQTEATFTPAYSLWVSLFKVESYEAHGLNDHLHQHAAQELGYPVDQLLGMLAVLKINRDAPLDELIAPVHSIAPYNPGEPDPLDNLAQAVPSQIAMVGEEKFEFTESSATDNTPDPALDERDFPVTMSRTAVPDGLMVASGLVPRAPLSKAGFVDSAAEDVLAGSQQTEMKGMDSLGVALHSMRALVIQFADIAGIAQLISDAPYMPYGFFMELPQPGVMGDTRHDLAVQAWWFLANLSGQLNEDIETLLGSVGPDGNPMLPDTGPDGYRAAFEDEQKWRSAVSTCLGQETLLDASFLVGLLTHPTNPLAFDAMRLFGTARQINLLRPNIDQDEGGEE